MSSYVYHVKLAKDGSQFLCVDGRFSKRQLLLDMACKNCTF